MLEEKAQNLIGDVSSLLPLIVSNTLNALAAILMVPSTCCVGLAKLRQR